MQVSNGRSISEEWLAKEINVGVGMRWRLIGVGSQKK